MAIFIALLSLSFIVFIHELGHALVAYLLGVRVEVFSIGFGKPYLSFNWGSTQIRISPFLFGGYCRMQGASLEPNQSYESLPPHSLLRASSWRRIMIYLAGPFLNIVFSFVAFSFVNFFGISLPDYSTKLIVEESYTGNLRKADVVVRVNDKVVEYYTDILKLLPEEVESVDFEVERSGVIENVRENCSLLTFTQKIRPWIPLKVSDIQANSPAKLAGLKQGDLIISINGQRVETFNELEVLKNLKGSGEYTLLVKRQDTEEELILYTAMPKWGIIFGAPLIRTQKAENFLLAVKQAYVQTGNFMLRAFEGIWSLIFSPFTHSKYISGPIGITGQLASASSQGLIIWLQLLGLISASLAAMNLFFPISLLDGGQAILALIEGLRKKRFTNQTLMRVHMVGLMIVFVLLIVGLFNDVGCFFLR